MGVATLEYRSWRKLIGMLIRWKLSFTKRKLIFNMEQQLLSKMASHTNTSIFSPRQPGAFSSITRAPQTRHEWYLYLIPLDWSNPLLQSIPLGQGYVCHCNLRSSKSFKIFKSFSWGDKGNEHLPYLSFQVLSPPSINLGLVPRRVRMGLDVNSQVWKTSYSSDSVCW